MNKTCDLCGDTAEEFKTVFDKDQNKEIDICDGCMDVAIEVENEEDLNND